MDAARWFVGSPVRLDAADVGDASAASTPRFKDGAIIACKARDVRHLRDTSRNLWLTCRFARFMQSFAHRCGRKNLQERSYRSKYHIAMRRSASQRLPLRDGCHHVAALHEAGTLAAQDVRQRLKRLSPTLGIGPGCVARRAARGLSQGSAQQHCAAARASHLWTYQRYATDIWYCRPAIGRPMKTPPVAAPGTRTLPSVRPSVSVTLLPLAVTSQCSPTCRLAPISSMS